MLQAGDDRLVDAALAERFVSAVGGEAKALSLYPALFHELFNEIEKDRAEETEAPLTVEVPTGIRAGVVSAPAATSCSSWSACYRIRASVAAE